MRSTTVARRVAAPLLAVVFAAGFAGCDLIKPTVTPLPMGWVTHEVKRLDTPYLAISAPVTWREQELEDVCCSILTLDGPRQPDGSIDSLEVLRYRNAPGADEDWVSFAREKAGFEGLSTEDSVTFLGGEAIRWTVSLPGIEIASYAFAPRDGILIVVQVSGDLEDPALTQAIVDTFEFLEPTSPSAS